MLFKAAAVIVVFQAFCLHINMGQFLTFKDGRIGVNFGGYHASAGLGGGGNGGFLSAEAGTPFGPAARAGLGGGMDKNGALGGKLYADATAGRGINARAGLGGALSGNEDEPRAGGELYAGAQAGKSHKVAAGLKGRTVGGEDPHVQGRIYSGAAAPGQVGAEVGLEGRAGADGPPSGVIYTKTIRPSSHRKVYTVVKSDAAPGGVANRFNDKSDDSSSSEEDQNDKTAFIPLGGLNSEADLENPIADKGSSKTNNLHTQAIPSKTTADRNKYITKTKIVRPYNDESRNEVLGDKNQRAPIDDGFLSFNKYFEDSAGPYTQEEPRPVVVIRKTKHPHVHHVHPKHLNRVVYKEVVPQSYPVEETAASGDVNSGIVYSKRYRAPGPTFFDDIFNIPISALTAVRGFLTNNVSKGGANVEKTVSYN